MAIQQGLFGRLLEPGLRRIFFEEYKDIPEQFSQVFKVQTSDKAIETDMRIGGFGLWETKDSAGSVKYQEPTGTAQLQYIHEEFASGFTVERKMVDDEQYNIINKLPANLGRAARATIETKAAQVLNQAFSTSAPTGGVAQQAWDGQALIASAHQRLDGGTMSNLASGALNDANLKLALILGRQQVDDRGILIQSNLKVLVVPPQLEYTAHTLLDGQYLSANGNGSGMTNDINAVKNKFRIVVLDYLKPLDKTTNLPATSGTSAGNIVYPWFLLDPSVAELNFFWRKKLEFKNTEDFDTMQAKYRGYMRFSAGFSDYRGIIASPGY